MSEENEQGEEKQNESLSSDEFEFYFSFTKPLVLDLPSSEDRAVAAAWVQKLETEPESEEEKQQRLNYLKLLLFVLQRGRLSGIFKKQPPSGPLQPFPQGFSILDMGNLMLDQDDGQVCGGGDARSVPYNIEISNDLREFVASQEIPNFGIQMYYAWSSDEPIHKWASFDEDKFPQFILDKIKQLKETKSDEKSSIVGGCIKKKKGCDFPMQDKYSKKKVKSPQEIERSQGRSFHTYMGLVRGMGNFNEKCNDDQDKYQKQDPRKGKPQKRNVQRKCPGNGGEAEDMAPEEEYDNLVSGLGGLNAQNKSCLCPYPCHHQDCPEHQKGGPQSFEKPPPSGSGRCAGRAGGTNIQNNVAVPSPMQTRRRAGEPPCPQPENDIIMPPQRCNPTPQSRSNSPDRSNMECPVEDNSTSPKQNGVCVCSSPPCTCPCPRSTPARSTPSANANSSAMKPCGNPSATVTKSPPKDPRCAARLPGRLPGQYVGNISTPNSTLPYSSPTGGRTCGNTGGKPELDIVHCYDKRNPDPYLIEKGDSRLPTPSTAGFSPGTPIYMPPTDMSRVRRQLFTPGAQSTVIEGSSLPTIEMSNDKFCSPIKSPRSPELGSHYLCENRPDEGQGPCPRGGPQQLPPPQQQQPPCSPQQQQYQQGYSSENSPADETCIRQPTDTYKKPSPPSASKQAPSNYAPCGTYAPNTSARLADMATMLQGMKQKTEAHREKCGEGAVYRSPRVEGNAACPQGSPQTKTQSKSRSPQGGYVGGAAPGNCAQMNTSRNMPGGPTTYSVPYSTPQEYNPHEECPGSVGIQNRGFIQQTPVPPQQMYQQQQLCSPQQMQRQLRSPQQMQQQPCPPQQLRSPQHMQQPCPSPQQMQQLCSPQKMQQQARSPQQLQQPCLPQQMQQQARSPQQMQQQQPFPPQQMQQQQPCPPQQMQEQQPCSPQQMQQQQPCSPQQMQQQQPCSPQQMQQQQPCSPQQMQQQQPCPPQQMQQQQPCPPQQMQQQQPCPPQQMQQQQPCPPQQMQQQQPCPPQQMRATSMPSQDCYPPPNPDECADDYDDDDDTYDPDNFDSCPPDLPQDMSETYEEDCPSPNGDFGSVEWYTMLSATQSSRQSSPSDDDRNCAPLAPGPQAGNGFQQGQRVSPSQRCPPQNGGPGSRGVEMQTANCAPQIRSPMQNADNQAQINPECRPTTNIQYSQMKGGCPSEYSDWPTNSYPEKPNARYEPPSSQQRCSASGGNAGAPSMSPGNRCLEVPNTNYGLPAAQQRCSTNGGNVGPQAMSSGGNPRRLSPVQRPAVNFQNDGAQLPCQSGNRFQDMLSYGLPPEQLCLNNGGAGGLQAMNLGGANGQYDSQMNAPEGGFIQYEEDPNCDPQMMEPRPDDCYDEFQDTDDTDCDQMTVPQTMADNNCAE